MYNNLSNQMKPLIVVASLMVTLLAITQLVHSAPTTSNSNNLSGNPATGPAPASSTRRPSIFLNLFRRQVNNSNAQSDDSESADSSEENETEMLPIEMEAQKYLETIPGYSNNNNNAKEPSSFRERMSDTFGLLRDSWSNQFKALRENFSDTVEDIRETWSGSQQD